MTTRPLHRLSSMGYQFLKRLGFSPSSNFYHRAQRKTLNKGLWGETKIALFDEAAAQRQGGNSLFARRLLDAVSGLPETPSRLTQSLFLDGVIKEGSITPSDDPELTKGQNDALSKCLGNDITFLMGAASTGKTRITAKAVSKLLEQNEAVLFCCNTRAALDHASERLDSSDASLTLSTIAGLINETSPTRYDTVVVDEAGMASLAEVLLLSDRAEKRVIFVGDPMQLPPIAITQNLWLSQSIFQYQAKSENLSSLYVWQRQNDGVALLLREQFDIPERLFNVLNHFCYGGRLFSRSTGKGHITFIDSTGLGAANTGKRSSPTNEVHAGLVIEALNQVLEKKSVSPDRIGVLTPLTAQASFLQKKVKEAGLPQGIEFGTVHTFQGRLKNCLILDTAAAGVGWTYQNLADDNQAQALMNSALSRCRTIDGMEGRLIVIADMEHMRQHYVGSAALQFLDRLFFRADTLDVENVQKYGQATAVLVDLFLSDWKAIDKALASGSNPKEEKIKTLIYNACDLIPRQIALINRLKPGAFSADSALQALEKPYALLGLAELSPETEFDPERINRFKSVITDLYKIIYESTMIPVPGEHRNRGPDKPIYDPNAEDGESYGRSRLWIRELRNYYQHDSEKPEDYRKDFSKRQRDFAFKAGIARTAPDESTISLDVPEDYSTTEYLRITLFLLTEVIVYLKDVRIRILNQ
ncbi:AAA family ATPase [Gammaproteobacteria bacterium]|nr:AAA family ATPase [Gammaproteobacteria bacterium]